jgi:hypothetical protein
MLTGYGWCDVMSIHVPRNHVYNVMPPTDLGLLRIVAVYIIGYHKVYSTVVDITKCIIKCKNQNILIRAWLQSLIEYTLWKNFQFATQRLRPSVNSTKSKNQYWGLNVVTARGLVSKKMFQFWSHAFMTPLQASSISTSENRQPPGNFNLYSLLHDNCFTYHFLKNRHSIWHSLGIKCCWLLPASKEFRNLHYHNWNY